GGGVGIAAGHRSTARVFTRTLSTVRGVVVFGKALWWPYLCSERPGRRGGRLGIGRGCRHCLRQEVSLRVIHSMSSSASDGLRPGPVIRSTATWGGDATVIPAGVVRVRAKTTSVPGSASITFAPASAG